MELQRFDQINIVSDIHLGGAPGFQIFNSGEAMASMILHLAKELDPNLDIGLVLNGDIVDFLAETPPAYLDPIGAVNKLDRIFKDPSFAMVWDALAKYVQTPKRHLVLVLGNHDVELSLPAVRRQLRERLCGQDEAAAGRLILSLDGDGYAARVGQASVLCVHGNEVDTWNVIDFNLLRRIKQALNRETDLPEWVPNAGTKMVIDAMNFLKAKYQWIDLLKPEVEATFPLILALDNDGMVAKKLRKIPGIAARLAWDSVRREFNFLSVDDDVANPDAQTEKAFQDAVNRHMTFQSSSHEHKHKMVEDALDEIEAHLGRGSHPLDLPAHQGEEEFLGVFGTILDKIRGRSMDENLRDALRGWLADDRTFDVSNPDTAFKNLDKLAGPNIQFLVAGHTHLQRALKRNNGSGFYFNSGTWIRLMQITQDMLDDDQKFADLVQLLKAGKMTYLDNPATLDPKLKDMKVVKHVRTLVRIEGGSGGVTGRLENVNQKEGKWTLQLVDKTKMHL